MKTITLTQGQCAMVDDRDFERVSQFKWHAWRGKGKSTFYAARNFNVEGRRSGQRMHRFIVEPPTGCEVHHKNGNGLDNQRENLQILTPSQHRQLDGRARRKRILSTNKSGFRGVAWDRGRFLWEATLLHGDKKLYLGRYECPEDAARARDAKARELGWPEEGMNFPQ